MSVSELAGPDPSDAHLRASFFRSVTLIVSLAGVMLAGSEERLFPSGLTPVFALIGWIFVDHLKWLRIPIGIGNLAAAGALIAVSFEFFQGSLLNKLYSGAHLIVYLTWIIVLMPKGHRQYWWLIALTLLHLAISGVLSTGAGFGASLIGMLLLLLWTMSVFSLYRVQDRHSQSGHRVYTSATAGVVRIRNGLQRDAEDQWIGWRFRGLVVSSCFVSLILAGFVFAAFPRVWVPGGSLFGTARAAQAALNRITGASETVELGSIGRLMASNQRVLSFSISDVRTGSDVPVEAFEAAMRMDEIRFRGFTLGIYQNGRWNRGIPEERRSNPDSETPAFGRAVDYEPAFRIEIAQDPPFSGPAFAPYPVSKALGSSGYRIHQRGYSGTLFWSPLPEGNRIGTLKFVVECPSLAETPDATFEYWAIPPDVAKEARAIAQNGNLAFAQRRYISPGLKTRLPRLWTLAQELCTVNGELVEPAQRVARILSYLGSENGFEYSLDIRHDDRSLDPVEDFLFNTKSGHCEYFSTACALMLQSVGMPARLVTGYLGSERNTVTGRYEVRQRHAHAWVETMLDNRWQTLEATPSSQRRDSVSDNRPQSLISDLQLAFSDLWTNGVHQMSAERQKEFFAPVIGTTRSLINAIREQGLWNTIRDHFRSFVMSKDAWFSWQGGAVTFLLLFPVGLLFRLKLHQRLLSALRLLIGWILPGRRSGQSVIRFYAGFCTLCERHGLPLPQSNSALENCRAAMERFGEQWRAAGVQDVPARIAGAFNEVRFGGRMLPDEAAGSLGKDLQLLAAALRPGK